MKFGGELFVYQIAKEEIVESTIINYHSRHVVLECPLNRLSFQNHQHQKVTML